MAGLGGLITGAIGLAGKAVPAISAISTALSTISAIKGTSAGGKILNTQILPSRGMGAPVSGGAPNLPVLSAGAGGIATNAQTGGVVSRGGWPDVSAGGSTTARGAPVKGHWMKNGQWSDRRRARMNPMNVSAARRAVRRIKGAEKLFRRIFSVTHPGAGATKLKLKSGKRC